MAEVQLESVNVEEQGVLARRLTAYMHMLLFAPCKPFNNFPFKVGPNASADVSVQAIVECFGKAQKLALRQALDQFLLNPIWCGQLNWAAFSYHLEPVELKRAEGGIQLQVRVGDSFTEDDIMLFLKGRSGCPQLWDHIETYADFLLHAQIRFASDAPFGDTSARIVRFEADSGVPLFVMVRLLHLLENPLWTERVGLGAVLIRECHGLPESKYDNGAYFLHEKLGLTQAPPP